MSIWSPYGRGVDAFWNGLVEMRSGAKPVERFNVNHWVFRTKDGAAIPEIPNERIEGEIAASSIMSQVAEDLLASDDIPQKHISPYETGLCIGSSHGGATARFINFLRLQKGDDISDDWVDTSAPLSSAAFLGGLALQLNVKGPSNMVSTACASGTSSIGTAYNWIRRGRVRRAYAGGSGYFTEIAYTGFNILRLTAKDGCRPFDTQRTGIMLGDAFALVALEEEQLAIQRGATIYARIAGYCDANEAHHPTSPEPNGNTALRVMWSALGRSQQQLAKLDYINAHGTGTQANDTAELMAIQRLLNLVEEKNVVAISSTKGHHGHSLGATGSVEFIATVLAMRNETVPATFGLETPEKQFEHLDLVRGSPRKKMIRVALSNSFAFGGNAASIAIERPT
jgi:3-oxoacyl-(acyl-carrier-protein) synthase